VLQADDICTDSSNANARTMNSNEKLQPGIPSITSKL